MQVVASFAYPLGLGLVSSASAGLTDARPSTGTYAVCMARCGWRLKEPFGKNAAVPPA